MTERSTPLEPVNDNGADARQRSEKLSRTRHVARGEQFAHPRRRDPAVTARRDIVHDDDLKTVLRAQGAQEVDVATATRTEPEVPAHEHDAGVKRLHEHADDELFG